MMESPPFALFLVGLLGAGHCVGMCGGIVGALTFSAPAGTKAVGVQLAYNVGRLASYVAMGAMAGAVGGFVGGLLLWQRLLQAVAALMLVAMGLYLLGATTTLAWLEKAGGRIWQRIQPLTQRFLPVRGIAQALPLGLLWGWLPCGLVYSALATALASGSAGRGAMAMLAFGLGTLPNLLLAGLVLLRFRAFVQNRSFRVASALVVTGYGLHGLAALFREIIRNP